MQNKPQKTLDDTGIAPSTRTVGSFRRRTNTDATDVLCHNISTDVASTAEVFQQNVCMDMTLDAKSLQRITSRVSVYGYILITYLFTQVNVEFSALIIGMVKPGGNI